MTSEWPPSHLVALSTTMSAPSSTGRTRYGEANVLSTTTAAPAACPAAMSAGRSATTIVGLEIDSRYSTRVGCASAAATAAGSVGSTKTVSTPNRPKTSVSRWRVEP